MVSFSLNSGFPLTSSTPQSSFQFFAAILEIPPLRPVLLDLLHFTSFSLSERMNRLFVDSICDLPPSRMNLVPLQNTNGLPLLVFFYLSFCCAVHNSENFHVNRCVFPFPSPPSWFKEVAPEITFFTKILRALWITETWYIYTHIFSTLRFKGAKTDGYSVYYFSE